MRPPGLHNPLRHAREIAAVSLVAAAVGMSGCGGASTVTQTVTVAKTETDAGRTTPTRAARTPKLAKYVRCDANVRAKEGTTSCPFAENVFFTFFVRHGARTISAYSPVRHKQFRLRCVTTRGHVRCATFVGGVVKFPVSAIARYSRQQASAFAARHNVGPQAPDVRAAADPTPTPAPAPPPTTPSTECDPNYSGCVPAGVGDVDCGDLSQTNIQVLGSDPDRLDADGDGVACES